MKRGVVSWHESPGEVGGGGGGGRKQATPENLENAFPA